jgi:KAP family P-loop domain
MNSSDGHWADDVLERQPLANFLHSLVIKRFKAERYKSDGGALCFAIDSEWGGGKTFFISRWAKDIENCDHPVFVFDAWRNDLSNEPLLGFLASFKSELQKWESRIPPGERVAAGTKQQLGKLLQHARRAMVPIFSVLLRNALKKYIGSGVEEIAAVVAASSDRVVDAQSPNEGNIAPMGDEAIDALFDTSLDEQVKRMEAVQELKAALEGLLERLEKKAQASLPMFIFIDELDRCRPTYAIELLEGVKHLFDAKGVCFIVSTNLQQLSQSTKAIYGSGFDTYRYFKRFFAFEYPLPAPNNLQFAATLVSDSFLVGYPKVASALPSESTNQTSDEKLREAFAWTADAFRLDLRSQQQIYRIAEAAAVGISSTDCLHALYLFVLAAIRHNWPEKFDGLFNADSASSRFKEVLSSIDRQATRPTHSGEEHSRQSRSAPMEIHVGSAFEFYLLRSREDLKEIREAWNQRRNGDYPNEILRLLAEELGPVTRTGQQYPPSIRTYPALVRSAGLRLMGRE